MNLFLRKLTLMTLIFSQKKFKDQLPGNNSSLWAKCLIPFKVHMLTYSSGGRALGV